MSTAVRPLEVVAHRGASAHRPEHTVAAYDLALELGADALELDLRATSDGELVVLHDRTLERTAGDPRAIEAVAAAELRRLPDALRPLTLAEVLARYGGRVRLVIELKEPQPAMERRLIAELANAPVCDDLVVQSFDEISLGRVRALDPLLPVAPLCDRVPTDPGRWLDDLAALGAVAIGVRHGQVDGGLVDAAHSRGLAVRAWTVNDAGEAARLAAAGVDGLITDAPGRVRAALAEPPAEPLALAA